MSGRERSCTYTFADWDRGAGISHLTSLPYRSNYEQLAISRGRQPRQQALNTHLVSEVSSSQIVPESCNEEAVPARGSVARGPASHLQKALSVCGIRCMPSESPTS